MGKQFLSRKEMAEYFCLSISSVNRHFKARTPPFDKGFKIGRRVLFPVSSLLSYSKVLKEGDTDENREESQQILYSKEDN